MAKRTGAATATSRFGVGRRESHDSSHFYARFAPPDVSADARVERGARESLNVIHHWDARDMRHVQDRSVALVVTSPPYFTGKQYEENLGDGRVPATYFEYLQLLEDVFAECVRKLEPGGRMAINVANLGRRPYRSLAADVVSILQDRLRLLLRGEIVWIKGRGARNSCAWGSFQSPANPVLRDLTERIIVASKGRFDRAVARRARASMDPPLPSTVTISEDEFMESTTDVWEFQPESAHRVGHPAPFPVELPARLMHLYTYLDDVVLDPFIGSGTTAVAAVETGRNYVGYDTDESYVDRARRRAADARQEIARRGTPRAVALPATRRPAANGGAASVAVREGRRAKEIARSVLEEAGFEVIAGDKKLSGGVKVTYVARDLRGGTWFFDVCGTFTSGRSGLRRTDALWRALAKAAVLHSAEPGEWQLVFLTTDLPAAGPARTALGAAKGSMFTDALEMVTAEGRAKLRNYAGLASDDARRRKK